MESSIYQPTTRDQYNEQGKSNSFINAKNAGRMTAGEAAKVLTERFGEKVLAKDIEPLATEFHHAGRFGKNQARRVFFFTEDQIERLTIEDVRSAAAAVPGWVLGFKETTGKYGRKKYVPIVAEVGLIDAARAKRLGNKFHALPASEIEAAREAIGKALPAFSNDWREAE